MLKSFINDVMSRPVTWGGYWKLCGVLTVIYIIVYGVIAIAAFRDEITEWFDGVKERFGWKNRNEEFYGEEP